MVTKAKKKAVDESVVVPVSESPQVELPKIDIKMLSPQEVKDSPGGLPYLISGMCKNHILQLSEIISAAIDKSTGLNDEQFKTLITAKLENMEKDLDEVAQGCNTLYKILQNNKLV